MVNVGSDEPAQIVTKLRQALDAVNRLSAERAALEEALKVEKNKDNILPRIMAVSGSYDRLFAEELKKYEPLKVNISPLTNKPYKTGGKNPAAHHSCLRLPGSLLRSSRSMRP